MSALVTTRRNLGVLRSKRGIMNSWHRDIAMWNARNGPALVLVSETPVSCSKVAASSRRPACYRVSSSISAVAR